MIKRENKNESWTVDVDGNVWAIKNGEIKKSTKCGDFKTIYTCDRSFDSLDVYNENNLIAWEDGGDAYTTVTEGKKQDADDAGTLVNPAKVGWNQLSDGTWNFYDSTGAKIVNDWANVSGVWYFLNVNGVMATGWVNVYGIWYYLYSDGSMAANTIINGYRLSSSGALI